MAPRSDILAAPSQGERTEPREEPATKLRSASDVLRGRTILVADAHGDSRELYSVYLESVGARVMDAQDGREALVKACGNHPDAVVADSQLPFIDGLELCRLLRLDGMTAQLPVILITASGLSTATDDLRRAGADAAFTKPFSPETLLGELSRLLSSDRTARVATAGANGDADGTLRDRRRRRTRSAQPLLPPPTLRCPMCDGRLEYERSHAGGIGARGAEQWDYFSCVRCGSFQYRHRTRKLRPVE
jgi:two-component system, cell cycle response regulator DivK